MAAFRRFSLPLLDAEGRRTDLPTLEVARRKLGGRLSDEPPRAASAGIEVGRVVALRDAMGVVLSVDGARLSVWIAGGRVRRVDVGAAGPVVGGVPVELARVADDIRLFTRLAEGDRVAFELDGERREGTLLEKCRFGALVGAADRKVMAVGFRRLWPTSRASHAEPS